MVTSQTLKFQSFRPIPVFYLIIFCTLFCQQLWASQDAMVIVDKAFIYSDQAMTSPIGYVSRGKKLVVGEIPRNKAQVYPIIVSGKVAYIRVLDLTTEKESMDSNRLTAERFQKTTRSVPQSKFVFSYYGFASQVSQSSSNGLIRDGDSLFWHGLSLKGEVLTRERMDVQLILNYMGTDAEQERYRVFELGLGAALRLINAKKFLLRLEGQLLGVPFSSYELSGDFRVKSFGYSAGGGVNMTWIFNQGWGVEAFGGAYYTKLLAFDAPKPFVDFSSSFAGVRAGLGVNYTY